MLGFLKKMSGGGVVMPEPKKSEKRKKIYKEFVAKGENKINDVIKGLETGDEITRKIAALALGKIGGKKAVDPLVKALGDPSRDVQENAMDALIKMEYIALQPLMDEVSALKHNNPDAQANAARVLGWLNDKKAVESLLKALRNNNEWVRWNATFALGKIGDKKAVESLKKARTQEVYPWVKEFMLNTIATLDR